MTDLSQYQSPRWLRDLRRFLPLKSQFVLTGNVRDLQPHLVGDVITATTLEHVIASTLYEAGYGSVFLYDPVRGFTLAERQDGTAVDSAAVFSRLGLTAANGCAPAGPDLLGSTLERLIQNEGPAIALLANFSSRLIVRSDALSPAEHQLFTRALVLSQSARARPVGPERTPLFNTILWVADKEGDLPDWLLIDNPRLRHIPIATPDRSVRRFVVPTLIRNLPGARDLSSERLHEVENDLVDTTEGMLLVDLNAIVQLARSEKVDAAHIGDAVRRYKVGVTEDAWRKIERRTIVDGTSFVSRRVIGQPQAVTHMLDIVKRAATGLGGRRSNRPRGLAFLAGPTGVGKTELAKTITELLFGDESAYIRFDMSEFSAEHADQRLIGAPPGYVGYDVGGELTNAVREKPFSVVLFDEIEKAHPRILDKFLQILDDGVLTSGRGDRVYFSESLIVFTSNLGIYTTDDQGQRTANVVPDHSYEEVRSRVRVAIEEHFKLTLNRPEILNRIGENIIVFDFIRSETASKIFDGMVKSVLLDTAEAGYNVNMTADARTKLEMLCTTELSNGGRGIRNKLEVHLVNPLARALFDQDLEGPLMITDLHPDVSATRLILETA